MSWRDDKSARWWFEELVAIPTGWLVGSCIILWLFNTEVTWKLLMAIWLCGVCYRFTEFLIRLGDRGH